MTEASNIDIAKRGYEAFGRGDMDTLLSLFDPDVEWITPGPPELRTAGRRRGAKEAAGFFQALGELFDIERFDPREFYAQGDRVVVLGDDTRRLKGDAARIEFYWAHVFDMRNGKVVRFREHADVTEIIARMHASQPVAR